MDDGSLPALAESRPAAPRAGRWTDPLDLAALAVVAALAALLLTAPHPPITDLPQQLAQASAFREALRGPSPYVIHWAHPNALFYGLLILLGTALPPLAAGKALYAGLAAAQVWLLRRWARRLGTSAPAFLMAALLTLNTFLYWGYGPFLLGGCLFLAWLEGLATSRPRGWSAWVLLALGLYGSHLFWLAFASVLAGLTAWRDRRGPAGAAARRALLAALPALLAATLWTLQGFHPGANNTAPYAAWPWARLDPRRWMLTFLGGVRGPWEPPLAWLVLGWTAGGLARTATARTATARAATPRPAAGPGAGLLLRAAALAAALYLALPDTLPETAGVCDRWVPWAFQAALLALPDPFSAPAWRRAALAASALAGGLFLAGSARAWRAFERQDLRGFPEVLARVPWRSRLLYLDFQRRSAFIRNQPFMQLGALAQVERQALPNATFADLASTFVAFREARGFNRAVAWNPAGVTAADLARHDAALLHAAPEVRRELAEDLGLDLSAEAGDWGLYRIRRRP